MHADRGQKLVDGGEDYDYGVEVACRDGLAALRNRLAAPASRFSGQRQRCEPLRENVRAPFWQACWTIDRRTENVAVSCWRLT